MIKYIMKCSVGIADSDFVVRFYADLGQLKDGVLRWGGAFGSKCECYNVQDCCLADLSDFIAYLYGELFYDYECVDEIEIMDMERYLDEKK